MTRAKPSTCTGCQCQPHGTDFSRVEGTGVSGLLVLAEASGEMEARDQLPLRPYAPAGSVFERALRRMGVDRQQLSVSNMLRCRPRNNFLENAPYEFSVLNHCRPNLDAVIADRSPRAILAMGGVATRELTGLAGNALGVSHLNGYVLPAEKYGNVPIIPCFHPAFLRRGKAAYQGIFARTIHRALQIAKGKDNEYLWGVDPTNEESHGKTLDFTIHPSLDVAQGFADSILAGHGRVVCYDIETFESASLDEDARDGFADTQLRLIQFSVLGEEGTGSKCIALPWKDGYKEIAQRILLSDNPKVGWNNWLFDDKVLRAAGEREGLDLRPRGQNHDGLAMYHHWQPDLPAHLQFAAQFVRYPFPWKHLAGTDLEFYGCCDVDATLRLYTFLEASLRKEGLWGDDIRGYMGQVYSVRPILAAMEDRGLPVDDVARVALGKEFDAAQRELGIEIAALAPDACKRVHPKVGYKGIPPEVKAHSSLFADGRVEDARFTEPNDGECYRYEQRTFDIAAVDGEGNPCTTPALLWCRVYDFNPNSGKQLIEYMKAKHHPIPKSKDEDADGNAKDTTGKKDLQRLARKVGDTFYLKVIEYRELSKAKGTYVDGFKPAADGCVHTTFTFDTAIAQLSSRNPNVQNFPKHGRLAKALRRMIAAKPGHVLTSWDYKSCHVLTLGFLAEDANYMRLARLDMHSFITGHLLGLWDGRKILAESDAELLARFKWLKANPEWKKVRDDRSKRTILGIGNGLKAKGLWERYPESFATIKDAQKVLDVPELIFPNIFPWQRRMQDLAHQQQYLKTDFGHMRRFYEVFRWDAQKMAWGHGDQAEEAIAYVLANVAHAHMRETMKQLHRSGLDEKYGLCDQIHDDLSFHFPKELLAEHVREVYPIMVALSTVLRHDTIAPNGLHIDCEASCGQTWAEMEPLTLPEPAMSHVPELSTMASN